jgi:cAMP-dependent protein kinase regulator
MAKDGRALREEAAAATATGKYKKALSAYLDLEHLEPRDAQWPKRAAETLRRLGKDKEAIDAFNRAADRYAQNGFLVQAMAVCKLILQIDPQHAATLRRLSQMNEQAGSVATRAGSLADNNPGLYENPNVAALRRASSQAESPAQPPSDESQRRRGKISSSPPYVSRTKSRPIFIEDGAPIDSMNLGSVVPGSHLRDGSSPSVRIIPIDDRDPELDTEDHYRTSAPVIDIEMEPSDAVEMLPEHLDESTELDMGDIEEIPLPAPRAIGAAAQRTLSQTPLFAGLPSEVLEALVEHLELVTLSRNEVLFREGDPSDALYVIVEGEVSVQAEGPPRVEMGRLGPGAFMGEVALMTDQPRAATVTAVTTAELLRIDRGTLASVLANHGDLLTAVLRFVRDRLVDRWTRASPLFRPFTEVQRIELASKFTFLEIDGNTVLLAANQRPDGLYIVLAGNFLVRRGATLVASLGPGDLIGETALLSGGAFKSEVVAHGKSLALCLPAADFRELIMTHPHVLEYVGEHAEQSRRLQIL